MLLLLDALSPHANARLQSTPLLLGLHVYLSDSATDSMSLLCMRIRPAFVVRQGYTAGCRIICSSSHRLAAVCSFSHLCFIQGPHICRSMEGQMLTSPSLSTPTLPISSPPSPASSSSSATVCLRNDRKRKVKCGEEKPTCVRCQNAKVECAGYADPITRPKKRASVTSTTTMGNITASRRSSATSSYATSSSANSAVSSATSANRSSRAEESSAFNAGGPVRKAVKLSSIHMPASPASCATSPQYSDRHQSFTYGAPIPQYQFDAPVLSRVGSTSSLPSQQRFSSAMTSSSTSPSGAEYVDYQNHHMNNHYQMSEEAEGGAYSRPAYSPTLAPPLYSVQEYPSSSQMHINRNTYTPFAFDSPFPLQQPFAHQYNNNQSNGQISNAGVMQHTNTAFGFDSLFEYTDKNLHQQQQQASDASLGAGHNGTRGQVEGSNPNDVVEAHPPMDYWEDAPFVDRFMSGLRDGRGNVNEYAQMRQSAQQPSTSSGEHLLFMRARVSCWAVCFNPKTDLLIETYLPLAFPSNQNYHRR